MRKLDAAAVRGGRQRVVRSRSCFLDLVAVTFFLKTDFDRQFRAMIYGGPSAMNLTAARLAIASFLVVRGPNAYMNADKATIEGRDLSNPHCEPQR